MRQYLLAASAALILSGGAYAQSGQAGSHNPAMKNGAPHHLAKPAKGANSFTADQAHGRFAKAGYTRISKLEKRDGLWRGTAQRHGKQVHVMLDYKGNITTR